MTAPALRLLADPPDLAPDAPAAQFICVPHPDGARVTAFLYYPDGNRVMTTDAVDAVSADARGNLLDRFGDVAAEEGHAFDRDAAESQLVARAGEI
ncbi:hypothetical protein, partial [Alienimonas sp. DA493]|uniref:hypothetical protein n=1 Tax=Alienimonas sp. DA493 TaxID=3373605 RepID=UPI00375465F3